MSRIASREVELVESPNTRILDKIEETLGEPLSVAVAERFKDAPFHHMAGVAGQLAPVYRDWLETEERCRTNENAPVYHCVWPEHVGANWQSILSRYRALLLYFPRLTIVDPLAKTIFTPLNVALLTNGAFVPSDEKEFRSDFVGALAFLSEVSPLVKSGDLVLFPHNFAFDYDSVQIGAQKDLDQSLSGDRRSLYRRLPRLFVEDVKVIGQVAARCDFTPVATTRNGVKLLQTEFQTNQNLRRPSTFDTSVAKILFQERLPGFRALSLANVINLRKNSEAFHEWRDSLGNLLRKVFADNTTDQEQFEVDFRQAAKDTLLPKIDALESEIRRSPSLSRCLIGSLLSVGFGGIAAHLTGLPFPVPMVGGALGGGPATWVIEKLYYRYRKTARNARVLRDFFAYLSPAIFRQH